MVTYALRPTQLSGCWATWTEQDVQVLIRTSMDVGAPKVRRRYTGVWRRADVSAPLKFYLIPYFWTWFRTNCQQGVLPTNIVEPDGRKAVWRFVEPPIMSYDDINRSYVTVSCTFERLPSYQWL